MEEKRSRFPVGAKLLSTGDDIVLVQVTNDQGEKVGKSRATTKEHPFTSTSITTKITNGGTKANDST